MKPNKNVRNFLNSFKQSTISIYKHTYTLVSKSWRLTGMFHDWEDIKQINCSSEMVLSFLSHWFPLSLSLTLTHSLTLSPHFLQCSRSLLCSGAQQEELRRLEDDKHPLPPLKWADWASLSPSSGTSQSTGAFSYCLWLRGMGLRRRGVFM